MKIVPGFMWAPLMSMAIKGEARKPMKEDEISLKALIAAMQYDIRVVKESKGMIAGCKNLEIPVLLLGGQKSQQFLKEGLDALERTLPDTGRKTILRVGHLAADNCGEPWLVAELLQLFFKEEENRK